MSKNVIKIEKIYILFNFFRTTVFPAEIISKDVADDGRSQWFIQPDMFTAPKF